MKNLILPALMMALTFASCESNTTEKTETTTETPATPAPETTPVAATLYACSMHPEVTGKKGDTCSKCGMDLTVPVK